MYDDSKWQQIYTHTYIFNNWIEGVFVCDIIVWKVFDLSLNFIYVKIQTHRERTTEVRK